MPHLEQYRFSAIGNFQRVELLQRLLKRESFQRYFSGRKTMRLPIFLHHEYRPAALFFCHAERLLQATEKAKQHSVIRLRRMHGKKIAFDYIDVCNVVFEAVGSQDG